MQVHRDAGAEARIRSSVNAEEQLKLNGTTALRRAAPFPVEEDLISADASVA